MATYLNEGNMNWSSASWQADNATFRKLDGTTSIAVTTSNKDTTAVTPGAITVDGICLLMASRVTSPTGTLTVTLRNSTAGTNVTSVTVNVSDLPNLPSGDASTPGVPVFFKFSASQLLLAATNYVIRVVGSTSNEVFFYGTSTTNFNRLVRTTTTGSVGAGDITYVVGNYLSAGSNNTYTVTQDLNAATDHGKIDIGAKGILKYSTAGNTQLRTSGIMEVWAGGELDMGTVATPVPDGTTAILEFDSSSNAEFGLVIKPLGTLVLQGYNKTYSQSLLAADAAATATSLTVADSVGAAWKNGDSIVLPSTTRTAGELEKKALTADGSGTTLTITALTNAHSGTTGTQAKLGNVTRNVKIRPVGAFSTYLNLKGIVNADWAEIVDIGSATSGKRGIDIGTTASLDVNIQNCGIHNTASFASSRGLYIANIDTAAAFVFEKNVVYNILQPLQNISTTNTTWSIKDNLFYGGTATSNTADLGGTFTGNRFSGNTTAAWTIDDVSAWGTNNNNVVHSNGLGLTIAPAGAINLEYTLGSLETWRNNNDGLRISPTSTSQYIKLTVDSLTAFGNANNNVLFTTAFNSGLVVFNSPNIQSDASFTTANGIGMPIGVTNIEINNGEIGTTQAHTTGDINVVGGMYPMVYLYDTTLGSSTQVANQTNIVSNGFIRSSRPGGVAGAYKSWFKYGTIENDTSVYNTASPSEKLTPNNATYKLRSAYKTVALNSGQTATVSVYVRKTAAGANQPRLVVKRNESAGITSDVVLATMSVGANTWEKISGTTSAVTENCVLTFYIETDSGNTVVNSDDWACILT